MDEEVFAFGSFRLIPAQRMLSEDRKPLRLGGRAFDILVALVERRGATISKEVLIARAWPDTVVEEAALRVHVAELRKALADGRPGERYIVNHPGRGYAFIAPVTRENAPRRSCANMRHHRGRSANQLPHPQPPGALVALAPLRDYRRVQVVSPQYCVTFHPVPSRAAMGRPSATGWKIH